MYQYKLKLFTNKQGHHVTGRPFAVLPGGSVEECGGGLEEGEAALYLRELQPVARREVGVARPAGVIQHRAPGFDFRCGLTPQPCGIAPYALGQPHDTPPS